MNLKVRALALLLAFLFILPVTVFETSAKKYDNTLKIISEGHLYADADESSSVLTEINEGSVVTLLESAKTEWAKVQYGDTVGYCQTRRLAKTSESGVKIIAYTKSDLNFRSAPEISSGNVIEVINAEHRDLYLNVQNNDNYNWAYVEYNGKEGYLSKDYLSIRIFLSEEYVMDDEMPNWFELSEAEVTSLFFSEKEHTIEAGNTYQTTVFSDTGKMFNSTVSFSSSDINVAVVNSLGNITAVSAGTAIITAALKENSSITASCVITVTENSNGEPKPYDSITLSNESAEIYVGNVYTLIAESYYPVTWTSSNSSVATVSQGVITAVSNGKAVITADNGRSTASCNITVIDSEISINISAEKATVSAGKTLFLNSKTTGVKWTSADTDIAEIQQMTDINGNEFAFILAKKEGTVSVTASNSSGAATCLLTITEPEPVRFAYSTPNSAIIGSKVSFIAITDLKRTAVKFEYTVNGKTSSVDATEKEKDGDTIIWTASLPLITAGEYSVIAYSKTDDTDFKTCNDGKTTAFVTTVSDKLKTSCEKRRVSDELMPIISSFEGFSSSVYLDKATGSDPTLGYGHVVSINSTFYNSITKREATAFLYETVNSEGYDAEVNAYLLRNEISFNQQQFDALVCFAYNLGAFALSSYDGINKLLLNSYSSEDPLHVGAKGKITATNVNLRSGPSTDYKVITMMDKDTSVTLISEEVFSGNWYYIRLDDGREGYVYGDYVSFVEAKGNRDLNNLDKEEFISVFMSYHHSGSKCYWGLIYRRIDEIEIFFEGDYLQDGKKNKYHYSYTCSRDPQFSIG